MPNTEPGHIRSLRSPLFHLIETIKMLCFYRAPAVCASMDEDVVTNRLKKMKEKCEHKKSFDAVSARVSTSIDLVVFSMLFILFLPFSLHVHIFFLSFIC